MKTFKTVMFSSVPKVGTEMGKETVEPLVSAGDELLVWSACVCP